MIRRHLAILLLGLALAFACGVPDDPATPEVGEVDAGPASVAPGPAPRARAVLPPWAEWSVTLPYRIQASHPSGNLSWAVGLAGHGVAFVAGTDAGPVRVRVDASGASSVTPLLGMGTADLTVGSSVVGRLPDGRYGLAGFDSDGRPTGTPCARETPFMTAAFALLAPGNAAPALYSQDTIMGCQAGGPWFTPGAPIQHLAFVDSAVVSTSLVLGGLRNARTAILWGAHLINGWPRTWHLGADTWALASAFDYGGATWSVGVSGACKDDRGKCTSAFLAQIAPTGPAVVTSFPRGQYGTPQQVRRLGTGEVLVASATDDGVVHVRTHARSGAQLTATEFQPRAGGTEVHIRELDYDPQGVWYVAGESKIGDEDDSPWEAWVTLLTPDPDRRVLTTLEVPGSLVQIIRDGDIRMQHAYVVSAVGDATVVSKYVFDLDADGLPAEWERDGIDGDGDGIPDWRPPDADPERPDIYLEYDTMPFLDGASASACRGGRLVEQAIGQLSGVLEPIGGARPIRLHLAGEVGAIPYAARWYDPDLEFRAVSRDTFGAFVTPDTILTTRAKALLAARKVVRHLAVIDVLENLTSGGGSVRPSGVAELRGNDLVVALGNLALEPHTDDWVTETIAGTVLHELGHSLGLRHGGGDDDNFKPNYHSVMNYLWQIPRCYRMPAPSASPVPSDAGVDGGAPPLRDCPEGTQRSFFDLDFSDGRSGVPVDEDDLGRLSAFSTQHNYLESWIPIGPPSPDGRLQLVPEGGDPRIGVPLWVLLYRSGYVGHDGRLHRDLNYLREGSPHDRTAYRDHDDWAGLDLSTRGAHWRPDVHDLAMDADTAAPLEIETRCADPYYGDPAFGAACACTPGETRACGGPYACVEGSQTCAPDGVFGACEGAQLPGLDQACASAGCPIDVAVTQLALAHDGAARTVAIEVPDGCGWVAQPDAPWLVVSPASAVGSATLTIAASPSGGQARTGTVLVNGLPVEVTQAPDTVAPVGAVVINGGAAATGSATVELTVTASDPSGVAAMCVSNSATSCTTWKPVTSPTSHVLSTAATVYLFLRDGLGNQTATPSPISDTIVLDKTAPSNGTVTAQPGDGLVELSWAGFADAGTGIAGYRVVVGTGASAPACTAPALYEGPATNVTHAGAVNGTAYRYRVCAVDGVGNVSTGATAFARPGPEGVPPTGGVVLASGAAWTRNATVNATVTGTDAAGVVAMCVSTSPDCSAWAPFATSTTVTLPGPDGPQAVYLYLRDPWGNVGGPFVDGIGLDRAAPSNPELTATGSSGQVALSWSASTDETSGLASYRVVFTATDAAPGSCAVGTIAYQGPATSFVHTGLSNGVRRSYRACALDVAGQFSTGTTASAIPAPEYEPPTGALTINDGASWTSGGGVTLAISGADPSGVTHMCLAATPTCTGWQAFAATRPWTLTTGSGTKTLYLWLRDGYGNVGGPFTDSIVRDNTSPTDGSLSATVTAPGTVALGWTEGADAHSAIAGYRVVVGTGATPPPVGCTSGTVLYEGPSLGVAHEGSAGVALGYRVCAIDMVGNTSIGATATITP